jgi:hypothetical protein
MLKDLTVEIETVFGETPVKQLLEYKTFESLNIGAPILDDNEKIKVKIVYGCKHDYRRHA